MTREADRQRRSDPSRETVGVVAVAYDPFSWRLPEASGRQERTTVHLALAVSVLVHLIAFAVSVPVRSKATVQPAEEPILFRLQSVRPQPRQTPPPEPPPVDPEVPPERRPVIPVPEILDPILPMELPLPPVLVSLPGDVVQVPAAPPPAPLPEDPVPYHSEMTRPVRVSGPMPQYTPAARRARVQGVVLLEGTIDRDGRVVGIRVLKSLPLGLEKAAVRAVRQWRFQPATLAGRPVAVFYHLQVRFSLQ